MPKQELVLTESQFASFFQALSESPEKQRPSPHKRFVIPSFKDIPHSASFYLDPVKKYELDPSLFQRGTPVLLSIPGLYRLKGSFTQIQPAFLQSYSPKPIALVISGQNIQLDLDSHTLQQTPGILADSIGIWIAKGSRNIQIQSGTLVDFGESAIASLDGNVQNVTIKDIRILNIGQSQFDKQVSSPQTRALAFKNVSFLTIENVQGSGHRLFQDQGLGPIVVLPQTNMDEAALAGLYAESCTGLTIRQVNWSDIQSSGLSVALTSGINIVRCNNVVTDGLQISQLQGSNSVISVVISGVPADATATTILASSNSQSQNVQLGTLTLSASINNAAGELDAWVGGLLVRHANTVTCTTLCNSSGHSYGGGSSVSPDTLRGSFGAFFLAVFNSQVQNVQVGNVVSNGDFVAGYTVEMGSLNVQSKQISVQHIVSNNINDLVVSSIGVGTYVVSKPDVAPSSSYLLFDECESMDIQPKQTADNTDCAYDMTYSDQVRLNNSLGKNATFGVLARFACTNFTYDGLVLEDCVNPGPIV